MLWKLQQGYSGGLGHSLFTNEGKNLVTLVPGQLYWWKLTEHHSNLWELISVLSKAVSSVYFLMRETVPGLLSANPPAMMVPRPLA